MRADLPTPSSTYRVQLQAGCTFDDAAAAVPYLASLGVSHLYCSPVLAAAAGSTHGYDTVDPTRVSPQLGGDPGRRRLLDTVREHGMGVVLDIVPNHLAVGDPGANPWWWDLLRLGRGSPYAAFFDVDWAVSPRLLLPVLGDPGDLDGLELASRDGEPVLVCNRLAYPLAPGSAGGTPAEVHARQHYELAHWRRAATELGYRRFFDITSLAGVRVEEPSTFEAMHALVLAWVRAGELDGLRVDHPDGLADPEGYLERLATATGGSWVVVEKVLGADENLPERWMVAGTTGYEALRLLDGLFVDPRGEAPLTELYAQLTGEPTDFAAVVQEAKLAAATGPLRAETERLARPARPARPARLAGDTHDPAPSPSDAPLPERGDDVLVELLAELLAALPVYRTYLRPDAPAADTRPLEQALDTTRRRRPDLAPALDALAPRLFDPTDELCRRFQQTSGMVMAKGVEDTAFYRYHRLAALCEVGGNPGRFGVSPEEFHRAAGLRERSRPASMTTISSHDTKRSADVRTRLLLLSEVAEEWACAARNLHALAAPHRGSVDDNLLYLTHQTVLGAWPIGADRLARYLEKASREAKQHTSWTDPDPGYDADVAALAGALLADSGYVAAVKGVLELLAPAEEPTARAHLLLHLTQPGVPDVYQGDEVGRRDLVDPDNRRPVDFAALARTDNARRHLVRAVLTARRAGLLAPGCGYRPLPTGTPHAVGFHRGPDTLVLAGRLLLGLHRAGGAGARELALPPGAWHDRLSGRCHSGALPLADLAAAGGVLLTREVAA